jgi:tRNA G26 N,N-dimethylase Trm1
MAGPIWNGPLCDHDFLARAMARLDKSKELFKTHQKIYGIMSVVSEVCFFAISNSTILLVLLTLFSAQELPDQPLFYDLSQLCRLLHIQQPSMAVFR